MIFEKFTMKSLHEAMQESIEVYEESEDKDDLLNPEAPITIMVDGEKFYVLSYGGDPDEEGLVLEAKPADWWTK